MDDEGLKDGLLEEEGETEAEGE